MYYSEKKFLNFFKDNNIEYLGMTDILKEFINC